MRATPIGSARPALAVVESVTLEAPADPYLSLRALAVYASCSTRWLRDRLNDPAHALPCFRLPGGKILVRRSAFDLWVNAYHQEGPAFAADVDRIVARFAQPLASRPEPVYKRRHTLEPGGAR
jgi:hypothetical protein